MPFDKLLETRAVRGEERIVPIANGAPEPVDCDRHAQYLHEGEQITENTCKLAKKYRVKERIWSHKITATA